MRGLLLEAALSCLGSREAAATRPYAEKRCEEIAKSQKTQLCWEAEASQPTDLEKDLLLPRAPQSPTRAGHYLYTRT